MTLAEVLSGVSLRSGLAPLPASETVKGLDYDSRRIEPGYLFFAFPGARVDGREFARQAQERGALAIVSELAAPAGVALPWIEVEHGRRALALASKQFYGKLDEKLN